MYIKHTIQDDDSQEDKLWKLNDYEKPLGNGSNESVLAVGPPGVSGDSVVSTV
jgi:hypothetical protein